VSRRSGSVCERDPHGRFDMHDRPSSLAGYELASVILALLFVPLIWFAFGVTSSFDSFQGGGGGVVCGCR
jgi:hypothetical protein